MRAVVCERYGDVGALAVREVEDPHAGRGQVVVDVHAAAVNFTDSLLVRDLYQVSAPLPFVPGSEVAGVVSEVGAGVERLAVGDRVFGMAFVGGFAERLALPAATLKPIPGGVDFAAAAAFFVASSTAYGALVFAGEVKSGETVVVLGAAGGVGLAAVQIATALGARVIAAASNPEKLAVCREEGAAATVDYSTEPLKERIKELTAGKGADVVIDPVGGALSEAAFRATGWKGRFVVVGFAGGEIAKIALNLPLLKGAEIRSFNIAPYDEDADHDGGGRRRQRPARLRPRRRGRAAVSPPPATRSARSSPPP
jgi:NADPH:quinone reductase